MLDMEPLSGGVRHCEDCKVLSTLDVLNKLNTLTTESLRDLYQTSSLFRTTALHLEFLFTLYICHNYLDNHRDARKAFCPNIHVKPS